MSAGHPTSVAASCILDLKGTLYLVMLPYMVPHASTLMQYQQRTALLTGTSPAGVQ